MIVTGYTIILTSNTNELLEMEVTVTGDTNEPLTLCPVNIPIPVFFNSLSFPFLLFICEDVFFTHSNFKTLSKSTSFAESAI